MPHRLFPCLTPVFGSAAKAEKLEPSGAPQEKEKHRVLSRAAWKSPEHQSSSANRLLFPSKHSVRQQFPGRQLAGTIKPGFQWNFCNCYPCCSQASCINYSSFQALQRACYKKKKGKIKSTLKVLLAAITSLWLKTLTVLNSAAEPLMPASGGEGKDGSLALGLAWTHISLLEKPLEQQPQHPASQDGPAREKLRERHFNRPVMPGGV